MLSDLAEKSSIKNVLKLVFSSSVFFVLVCYYYCSASCDDSGTLSKNQIVQSMAYSILRLLVKIIARQTTEYIFQKKYGMMLSILLAMDSKEAFCC
jgi:hypothetical protein